MILRRTRRTSVCALAALACAVAGSGCASLPRIDPTGERVLIWPGQAPPVVAAPPTSPPPAFAPAPFATAPAPSLPPPVVTSPPPGSTFPTTPPPPVITTPPPPVGLPPGNLQAAPVYPDAGLQPTPPPVITVPSSPPPAGAPFTSAPTTAIPLPPPPTVDAQFAFPSPTIAQAGYPLVLTTLVTRQSDRAPLPGWTVRYEVSNANASVGGPGNSRVEVPTDANGRASIEISPTSVGPGNAIVNMTVVQPPTLTAGATAAEVGRGSATITWREGVPGAPAWTPGAAMAASAFQGIPSDGSPTMPAPSLSGPPSSDTSSPDLTYGDSRQPNRFQPPPSLSKDSTSKTFAPPPKQEPAGKPEIVIELRRRGPAQVEVGGFASFEVIVTNRGEATARNIKLLDRFDAGLSHVRAVDNELAVKYEAMRDLAPGDSETVPLTFGVRAAGELCHEVSVTADGVAPVIESGCVTATEARPSLPTDPRSHEDRSDPALRGRERQVSRRRQEHRRSRSEESRHY